MGLNKHCECLGFVTRLNVTLIWSEKFITTTIIVIIIIVMIMNQ